MRRIKEWLKDAVCRKVKDPDIFFPSVGARAHQQINQTRIICSMCAVQQDCLDYAVAHNEKGFWGGKSEKEREQLPSFVINYIKSEYLRLGLLEQRLNIDALIVAMRKKQQEEQSQEALSS